MGEVAEGVVVGDQLALGRGHGVDAAGDAGVELAQASEVGGAVAIELAPMGGVGGGEAALDLPRTAASALRGSCHQCGSYLEASAPLVSPGSRSGTTAPRSTTAASLPLSETTWPIQLVEVVAVGEDQLRAAAASTSLGRGSYSCGSVLGWRI